MDHARSHDTPPANAGDNALAEPATARDHDRAAATAPFLSLYLLVLVFFIVLVSISAREEAENHQGHGQRCVHL